MRQRMLGNEDDRKRFALGEQMYKMACGQYEDEEYSHAAHALTTAIDIFERLGNESDVAKAKALLAKAENQISPDNGKCFWAREKATNEILIVEVSVYRGERTYFRIGSEEDQNPEDYELLKPIPKPKPTFRTRIKFEGVSAKELKGG